MSTSLPAPVEQALYSLIATADDECDEGNSDRAKLLHACANTLGAEITRLRAELAASWRVLPAEQIAAAVLAEREACALIAGDNYGWVAGVYFDNLADAIRARGDKP